MPFIRGASAAGGDAVKSAVLSLARLGGSEAGKAIRREPGCAGWQAGYITGVKCAPAAWGALQ